jgi:hypothetical protein
MGKIYDLFDGKGALQFQEAILNLNQSGNHITRGITA